MSKPQMDKTRPLSWSAISSFEYDKEQWYKKYVLGEPQHETAELKFGKEFATSIEDGTCQYMHLFKVQSKVEKEFKCMFGKIPLIGFADSFCEITDRKLEEYKTGVKPWDQKRVDQHGQLTMYLLMHWIINKVRPEDVEVALTWFPTKRTEDGNFEVKIEFIEPVEPKRFITKRTMKEVLAFGMKINKIWREMQEYAENHE